MTGGPRPSSGTPPSTDQHYSYRVYADPAMAGAFDALRFSGPIGTLVAEDQARVLATFVGEIGGRRILDVGTGTGRAALALAAMGAVVTGVDASEEMLAVARDRASAAAAAIDFQRGDAHDLPFSDKSFDVAVCLRVLMHAPDWRRCLTELCRVAERRVVFDYPAALSVAAVQSVGRKAAAAFGARTEAYRVLRHAAVTQALAAAGFRVADRHRQFVLPIAFHKAINSRGFTRGVEGACARLGLLRLFGSPVTVVAER